MEHCDPRGMQDMLCFCFYVPEKINEDLFNDCVCYANYDLQEDHGERTGRDLVSLCLPGNLNVPQLVDQGRVVATLGKKSMRKIVHACWLDFSPETCMRMLSDLQRILGRWQQSYGMSVGLEDCLVDIVSFTPTRRSRRSLEAVA